MSDSTAFGKFINHIFNTQKFENACFAAIDQLINRSEMSSSNRNFQNLPCTLIFYVIK
jgi:hypothetical protein